MHKKLIVLDDDPTGIQTVHDVLVVTTPTRAVLQEACQRPESLFYILTNSRSFTEQETVSYHQKLIMLLLDLGRDLHLDITIISRSDSTLRGHYPLETEVIRSAFQQYGKEVDAEILCPYLDGIRKTANDIHYIKVLDTWLPCGESEFSKDPTFGYQSSDLKAYVEEKTKGRYLARDCISISLQELKCKDITSIVTKLSAAHDFQKIIVNADCMEDLITFVTAYEQITQKHFLFRCAASLVKCLGHISDQPLLTSRQCVDKHQGRGGLVLAGSHVSKTAAQLAYLKQHRQQLVWITFDQHTILTHQLHEESLRVSALLEAALEKNQIVVVATRRDRVDYPQKDPQKQLEWATMISKELIGTLQRLQRRPKFLITKGGITSSDALTIGLAVQKEWVLGQILPNIGVVQCMEESHFPGLPVVVFPGNVGDDTTLYQMIECLASNLDQCNEGEFS